MPYNPNEWEDLPSTNTPISAERLTNLETQHAQAVADAAIDATTKADAARTAAGVYADAQVALEAAARAAADAAEAAARGVAITSAVSFEVIARNAAIATEFAAVGTAINAAVADEVIARDAAISVEMVRAVSAEELKANDTAVVHKTGNETIAGIKTFSSAPVLPDASLTVAKTSGLQTALDGKVDTSTVGQPLGIAPLDAGGKIASAHIPPIAITDTFVVASQAAMLALSTATTGDVAVRTDTNKTFILQGADPAVLGNWVELSSMASVISVAGKSGAVALDANDISDVSTTKKFTTAAEATKLAGIATGATANATNAELRDRATHTGEQAQSSVTGLVSALAAKVSGSEKAAANGVATLDKYFGVVQYGHLPSQVSPEAHGAFGDGLSHTMTSLGYANLAAAQVDYPEAIAMGDEADWCAIRAALSAVKAVRLTGGSTYLVNRTISIFGDRALYADNGQQSGKIMASTAFDQVNYTGRLANPNSHIANTSPAPRVLELVGSKAGISHIEVSAANVSYKYRGAWVSGTSYVANDMVTWTDANNYIIVTPNADTVWTPAKWSQWTAGATPTLNGKVSTVDCIATGWGSNGSTVGGDDNDSSFSPMIRDVRTTGGRYGFWNLCLETHMDHCLFQDASKAGLKNSYYDLFALDVSTNRCYDGYSQTDGYGSAVLLHVHAINSIRYGFDIHAGQSNLMFGCHADTSGQHGFRIINTKKISVTSCFGFQSSSTASAGYFGGTAGAGNTYSDFYLQSVNKSAFTGCHTGGASYTRAPWHFINTIASGSTFVSSDNSINGCDASGAIVGPPTGYLISAGTGDFVNYQSYPTISAMTAADAAVQAAAVQITNNQTIAGVKTFTSAPVVPDASFTIAKTSGLQTALDAKTDPQSPGMVSFDSFGSTDDARIAAMNEYHRLHAGGILKPVVFPSRIIAFSTPIKLFSGMMLVGNQTLPVREYTRHTTFDWNGGSNTSVFIFPTEGQTNQGYPSDGSPRDVTISGIMFMGGTTTDVFPKRAMNGTDYVGATLWYFNLHNVGAKNMRTFWWGYGTGVSMTGNIHFQAMQETPIFFGGSENAIMVGGQSFMDNTAWGTAAKPMIRSIAEKSSIGQVMPTARGNSWQISVEGGRAMIINGVQFDSQTSDPVSGANLRISGVDGLTVTNCIFKGGMNNPSGGSGGESNNRGIIQVTGGNNLVFTGNQFSRVGTAAPATTPLVYATSGVAANAIKWGLNGFYGYNGVLRQAAAGKIATIDPTTSITTG